MSDSAPTPPPSRPTRRAVTGALLCGGALVAAGAAGFLATRDDEADGPDAARPVSADEALVAVGTRYLRDHPEEADRARLLAALGASDDGTSGADVLAERTDRVSEDFAAGDVVEVDGWVLSLTEVRVAALVALDA